MVSAEGQRKRGSTHKGSAKKSEARNEQRFPLARAALALGDGTYCKGNSVHSRSLPPLVNHCNIHGGVVKPPTASARTFSPHAKLFAYRSIGPSNCVIQLKLQLRSNCAALPPWWWLVINLKTAREEENTGAGDATKIPTKNLTFLCTNASGRVPFVLNGR